MPDAPVIVQHPIDAIPQTTGDFEAFKFLLHDIVIQHRYQRVVEVGTDVGDSTRVFSSALQATAGQLITIDKVAPKNNWPETCINGGPWPIKNIKFITSDVKLLQWKEPIDLLFLDGDHTYEALQWELSNLGIHVREGGKVLCHDIYHSEFGEPITKAVKEWAKLHELCWTAYPHQHGLAIIEVSHPLQKGTV